MREEFDFDVALAALQDGQGLTGKDGILTPLVKQLTEAALQAELEAHLKADKSSNRRNGAGRKTIKSTSGSLPASGECLSIPAGPGWIALPSQQVQVKKHVARSPSSTEQQHVQLISMFGFLERSYRANIASLTQLGQSVCDQAG